jgi:hypothetical protein
MFIKSFLTFTDLDYIIDEIDLIDQYFFILSYANWLKDYNFDAGRGGTLTGIIELIYKSSSGVIGIGWTGTQKHTTSLP